MLLFTNSQRSSYFISTFSPNKPGDFSLEVYLLGKGLRSVSGNEICWFCR